VPFSVSNRNRLPPFQVAERSNISTTLYFSSASAPRLKPLRTSSKSVRTPEQAIHTVTRRSKRAGRKDKFESVVHSISVVVIEINSKSHGGDMKKYIIEREIPKIGSLKPEQLREGAAKSNQVLCDLGPNIQWQESFVTGDKMFCVYLTNDEALIRLHADLSGFPATKVTEIVKTIDPTTANAVEDRQISASESKIGTQGSTVKQKLQTALLVCGLLFTLIAPAAAQGRSKATIPFDFTVGDTTLTAGEYTIEALSSEFQGLLSLRDSSGTRRAIVHGVRIETLDNNGHARLLFSKVNDRYSLTQVWPDAAESGISIPQTRLQRELVIGSDQRVETAVAPMAK
jgi:hypothetical protein